MRPRLAFTSAWVSRALRWLVVSEAVDVPSTAGRWLVWSALRKSRTVPGDAAAEKRIRACENRRTTTAVLQAMNNLCGEGSVLMPMMSKLNRSAGRANDATRTRLNHEGTRSVKRLRRARLMLLSAAAALAGAATVMTTAGPAYANSTPSITAYGGPGEIWVTGFGFTPDATVRVEALSQPGLKGVGSPQNTRADGSGNIGVDLYNLSPFTGSVYVAADQVPYLGTAWATTTVNPLPQFLINGTGQTSCGSVNAEITGFEAFYNVRVELLSQDLTKLLDTKYVKSDFGGVVSLSPSLAASGPPLSTSGYTGGAWIVADEYGGYPPAPATTWYHLNVC